MGILIRLEALGVGDGDTAQYRVVLASGTLIGWVLETPRGQFAARVPWGLSLPGWLAQGDCMTFTTLTDAAAAVWLGHMALPLEAGESSRSGRTSG